VNAIRKAWKGNVVELLGTAAANLKDGLQT
jgi:hypothetical protein